MEEQAAAAFMELMNWPAFLVATLVPMVVGFCGTILKRLPGPFG